MRVEIKLTDGQLNVLKQLNAAFEQAKKELDIAISSIVLGRVKSGKMNGITNDILSIEVESEGDVLEPESPSLKLVKE